MTGTLQNDLLKVREASRLVSIRLDEIIDEIAGSLPQPENPKCGAPVWVRGPGDNGYCGLTLGHSGPHQCKPDPKPTAEVGDWVRLGGFGDRKWREVDYVAPDGTLILVPHAYAEPSQVIDVYTKAEQAANGALVQFWSPHGGDGWGAGYAVVDDIGGYMPWHVEAEPFEGFWFLTDEATAALGTFTKIDREINVGDCVRFKLNFNGRDVVEVVQWINPIGSFGGLVESEDGRGWSRQEHEISLVAKEDPAYREASERGESVRRLGQMCPTCMGSSRETVGMVCQTCGRDYAASSRPDPAPEATEGCACGRQEEHGPHEFDLADPAPEATGRGECTCPEHTGCVCSTEPEPAPEHPFRHDVAPFDCAVCGEKKGSAVHQPDNAPTAILSHWDLVTVGGRRFAHVTDHGGDVHPWIEITLNHWGEFFSDAEILALGPVKRAVAVTLPELPLFKVGIELAAELLAAALQAEGGE